MDPYSLRRLLEASLRARRVQTFAIVSFSHMRPQIEGNNDKVGASQGKSVPHKMSEWIIPLLSLRGTMRNTICMTVVNCHIHCHKFTGSC